MNAKDGGPAFPAPSFIVPRDLHEAGCRKLGEAMGMTLRDYFAAKVMQGLCGAHDDDGCASYIEKVVAYESYKMADAMLKAREP